MGAIVRAAGGACILSSDHDRPLIYARAADARPAATHGEKGNPTPGEDYVRVRSLGSAEYSPPRRGFAMPGSRRGCWSGSRLLIGAVWLLARVTQTIVVPVITAASSPPSPRRWWPGCNDTGCRAGSGRSRPAGRHGRRIGLLVFGGPGRDHQRGVVLGNQLSDAKDELAAGSRTPASIRPPPRRPKSTPARRSATRFRRSSMAWRAASRSFPGSSSSSR